jgi:DNA repair protein RadD
MLILRPYQEESLAAIYRYFETKKGNPLIVIPTAGGKSLVIASFIEGVLKAWPDQRILILTHVRELIAQNHAEMMGFWPEAPAGIYSAGLGRRDADARILFAGIQSVHKRAAKIGHADLVLVDEAHLIPGSGNTMYRRFLEKLRAINPALKVIGFTATPFRLDSGMLHQGANALFTDIAYEVPVRALIDQGYLSPLISKATTTALDVGDVASRGGEFIARDLQAAVDKEAVTTAAVDEIVRLGADRKAWLAFCSGVDHARHVAQAIRERGFSCATIFGDTPKDERDRIITAFKRGELRALASMGVLTTGFNAPGVDLIAMLRPTKSPGLYVQMAGRGTRLAPGKENCLVLDFAGNVTRHGPIDLVRPKNPVKGDGDAPVKTCPECDSLLAISAQECPDCGYAFPPPAVQLKPKASSAPILSNRKPQWVKVTHVSYAKHRKPGKAPSLRADYQCGLTRYSEWVCLEHQGYARRRAESWWRARNPGVIPKSIDGALTWIRHLATPVEIQVRPNGRFSEIINARFDPCAPNQSDPQTDSAPSVTARPGRMAGSMLATPSMTRVATRPGKPFAAGPANPFATGEKA